MLFIKYKMEYVFDIWILLKSQKANVSKYMSRQIFLIECRDDR
jgi:hypothetical protein